MPFYRRVRGVRASLPSGTVIGRKSAGTGAAEIVSPADVVRQGSLSSPAPPLGQQGGVGVGTDGQVWATVGAAAAWSFLSLLTKVGTITSGVWNGTKIALGFGGTGADLSATGPGFLKQATLGANVSVAALVNADLPTSGVTAGSYTITSLTVNAQGIITAASSGAASGTGTVTSVSMTVPAEFAVGGSPITTAGTLAVTWAAPVTLAHGGSGVNMSATGPGYVKQATLGANFTVSATIPYSDVTGGPSTTPQSDWDAYVQGAFGVGAFGSGGFGSLSLENANNGQIETGVAGQAWLHGGAGAVPNWGAIAGLLSAGTGITISGTTTATIGLTVPVSVTNGGTSSNLGGTGGASQVLKQTTVGGAVTVGQLNYTDLAGSPPVSGAWTAYTPTVGATSGMITTSSPSGRYRQDGKTVFVQIRVDITTNGTGSGSVTATLPVAPFASAVYFLSGREIGVSGKVLSVTIANSLTVNIQNYDNTYPGANGASLTLTGVYEAA